MNVGEFREIFQGAYDQFKSQNKNFDSKYNAIIESVYHGNEVEPRIADIAKRIFESRNTEAITGYYRLLRQHVSTAPEAPLADHVVTLIAHAGDDLFANFDALPVDVAIKVAKSYACMMQKVLDYSLDHFSYENAQRFAKNARSFIQLFRDRIQLSADTNQLADRFLERLDRKMDQLTYNNSDTSGTDYDVQNDNQQEVVSDNRNINENDRTIQNETVNRTIFDRIKNKCSAVARQILANSEITNMFFGACLGASYAGLRHLVGTLPSHVVLPLAMPALSLVAYKVAKEFIAVCNAQDIVRGSKLLATLVCGTAVPAALSVAHVFPGTAPFYTLGTAYGGVASIARELFMSSVLENRARLERRTQEVASDIRQYTRRWERMLRPYIDLMNERYDLEVRIEL